MTIHLTMRQLQMIRALEQTGSISEAALALRVSQSALSHRIREAERLLGTELYWRRHKKLVANPAGQRIEHAARIILTELERTEQDITQLEADYRHHVRLGTDVYASTLWLPQCYTKLAQDHDDISVQLCADVSLNPLAALQRNSIDLALVSALPGHNNLDSQWLLNDHLVVLCAPTHPWAHSDIITPEDFTKQVYIAHHTNPEQGQAYDQVFRPYGLLPQRVLRVGMTEAVLALVAQGHGVTILPHWTASFYTHWPHLPLRCVNIHVDQAQVLIDWYIVGRKGDMSQTSVAAVAHSIQSTIQAGVEA